MGVNYSCSFVLGVAFTKEELFEEVYENNCEHNFKSKFCPDCGKPKGTQKVIKWKNPDLNSDEYKGKWEIFYSHILESLVVGIEIAHWTETDILIYYSNEDESDYNDIISSYECNIDLCEIKDLDKYSLDRTQILDLQDPRIIELKKEFKKLVKLWKIDTTTN